MNIRDMRQKRRQRFGTKECVHGDAFFFFFFSSFSMRCSKCASGCISFKKKTCHFIASNLKKGKTDLSLPFITLF